MMCFGIANALGSMLAGFLTKTIGRYTVITVNAIAHMTLLVWLIHWQPEIEGIYYCVIAAVWGCCNGIWLVQINGEDPNMKFTFSFIEHKSSSFQL